jgi:hypothetical protein
MRNYGYGTLESVVPHQQAARPHLEMVLANVPDGFEQSGQRNDARSRQYDATSALHSAFCLFWSFSLPVYKGK